MSAARSCQNIVRQAALQRLAGGLSAASTRTGGYCLARQRLPLEMVSTLTQHLGGLMDDQAPDPYRIRLPTKRRFRSSVDSNHPSAICERQELPVQTNNTLLTRFYS